VPNLETLNTSWRERLRGFDLPEPKLKRLPVRADAIVDLVMAAGARGDDVLPRR